MDGQQFDALVRSLSHSRRALLGLGAALGLAPLAAEARKRKKKKSCKGNTKKCGKRCVPKTGCCSSADCGPGSVCVNNLCQCAPGLRPCNGVCITQEQCCSPSECAGQQTCIDGSCQCPANTISCDNFCCDAGNSICQYEFVNDQYLASCLQGDCPATDYCISDDIFVCQWDAGGICVCTTTTDAAPQNVCIAIDPERGPGCEAACTTSADCADGQVCIRDGTYCGCGHHICAPLCENGITRSVPARSATGVSGERLARRRISR